VLIEFQDSPEDFIEVTLTFTNIPYWTEEIRATSPWPIRFKNLKNLIRFIEDNFGIELDFFEKWMLMDRKNIYPYIDFDESEIYSLSMLGRSIEDDIDVIRSNEFPRDMVHDLIDATMNDFAGESLPQDFNFELADFVYKEGRGGADRVFYYFFDADYYNFDPGEPDSDGIYDEPAEQIVHVHLIAPEGNYVRSDGHWKLMNTEEWNRLDNTVAFNIDPRCGREFLKEYDNDPLCNLEAEEFSMDENQTREFFANHDRDSHDNDFGEVQRVNVFRIDSEEDKQRSGMSETQSFDIEGGRLIIRDREWAILAAHPTWDFVTDFPSMFHAYCSDLPFLIPDRLSCEDWVNELNSLSPSQFRVNPVPIRSEPGSFDAVLNQVYRESKSTHGVAIIHGEK
jgi:hypothetical protein